jgi:Glycoside hydrolase family 44/Bacterial Ig-like domain (group 3)
MHISTSRTAFLLVVASILLLGVVAPSCPQTPPTLIVDAAGNQHAINPDIYGIANYGLDATYAKEIQVPNIRWGGDGTTRYNWQVDSSNAGFDWYFMSGNGQSTPTPSASADLMIQTYKAASNAKTLLTVPIIPWVNNSAVWNCSFPVSVYGAQQSTNPYVHPNGGDCGNSIAAGGTQLLDKNIYTNHIDNTVALQQGWIEHLVSVFGSAANGGVTYYQLDNEPGGWSNTHRDVEPVQPDYDTIVSLGQQYAAMIKQVDPSAKVFGPVDFTLGGWIGTPSLQNNLYAGQYYLQRMAAYDQANNQRILDYFDEHYYGGGSTDAAELESTRALWDPTFNSGSWVEQYYFDGPIELLPRFQSWIQNYYPGTKLSISEYSFASGTNPLVDMLTETDVLGIYGRQSLDFANMWNVPKPSDPVAYAFRIYRNYDGAGGQFGDTSVSSSSTDQSQLSVYGALRSADGALTVVAINKTTSPIQTTLTLANFKANSRAPVFTYSNANLTQIVAGAPVAVASNQVNYTFPAYSVSVLVFSPELVIPASTTTTLTASSTQLTSGQSVKFTAIVDPQSGSGIPTGTATFFDGTNLLGTATVASGVATLSTKSLATGLHTISAVYNGDSNFSISTSPPVNLLVLTPPKIATSTSATLSATQLATGQTLTIKITVTPVSGAVVPTGTVTILDGQTQLGAATLASPVTSFSISTLAAGNHFISVDYSGDSNFSASTSTMISVTISTRAKANSATTLSATPSQITAGSSVNLAATVIPAEGSETPTGTVTFLDSQTSVGTINLSGGSAQLSVSTLGAGVHTITASYSGDANLSASSSSAVSVTVQVSPAPDYSFLIGSRTLKVISGNSGTMTITVTPENGFKQAVTFACSGLPGGATCTFRPQTVTPSAASATTILTVNAPALSTASGHRLDMPWELTGFPLSRTLSAFSLVLIGSALIVGALSHKQAQSRVQFLLLTLSVFAVTVIVGGCASLSGTPPPEARSTTYTVTVTATGPNVPTHSQTFTLMVEP